MAARHYGPACAGDAGAGPGGRTPSRRRGARHGRWRARGARRLAVAQRARPNAHAVKKATVHRGVECCRRKPGHKGRERRGRQGDRAAHGLGPPEQPVRRDGDPVAVHDRVRRGHGEADRARARRPARRHGARPGRRHSPTRPTPRERGRRGRRGRAGWPRDRNEPTTTLAANTPVSRPMTPPERPSLCPMTTMQNSRPEGGEVQQAVQERRRAQERLSPGERQSPSAARRRAEPGSRCRSSWNGARMSRSETVEQA